MNHLWSVYHEDIPQFLQEFAATPPMQRLQNVGMNCGCEYTAFPLFKNLEYYSRFDHSLGAALIVWHFTADEKQTLAALFHDVTTPVFSHVVDFLNGDYLQQESTEAGIAETLAASPEVQELLAKYGIAVEEISDYHCYPIADNDAPALSSDRLEYTMGNLLNYHLASLAELRELYEDLTVGEDENGCAELIFRTAEKAARFARLALQTGRVYVSDEDRFAMEALADVLRHAIERGVLTRDNLMETEPPVIAKLTADAESAAQWYQFCGYSHILRQAQRPAEGFWVQVDAKKRRIDPLAAGKGRVSAWHDAARTEMADFLALDFTHWLSAE